MVNDFLMRPRAFGFSGISRARCPHFPGGLNWSPQHFILEGKDGVWDGTEIS